MNMRINKIIIKNNLTKIINNLINCDKMKLKRLKIK